MRAGEEKDLFSQLQNKFKLNPQIFHVTDGTIPLLRKAISELNNDAVRFIVTNANSETTRTEIINLALRHAIGVPFFFTIKKQEMDDDQRRELCRIIYILKEAGADFSLQDDQNNQCYFRLLELLIKHQSDMLNALDPQKIKAKRCALLFIARLIVLDQGRTMGTSHKAQFKQSAVSKTIARLKKLFSNIDLKSCSDEEINQLLIATAPFIHSIIINKDSFVSSDDIKALIELNTELKLEQYIDKSNREIKDEP